MRLLALLAALAAPTLLAAAPVPKAKAKRPDAEVFVGTWETVVAEANGRARTKATWTFDDKLKMLSVPQGGTSPGSEWKIKIDPERTPKEIDIDTLKGIYEFDGDDIRVAFSVGGDRPTSFDSKEGVHYIVLRRADPKKDK